ncbi:hypothetical protein SGPA1_20753 [Streptomyces misionensis JCM 4497]
MRSVGDVAGGAAQSSGRRPLGAGVPDARPRARRGVAGRAGGRGAVACALRSSRPRATGYSARDGSPVREGKRDRHQQHPARGGRSASAAAASTAPPGALPPHDRPRSAVGGALRGAPVHRPALAAARHPGRHRRVRPRSRRHAAGDGARPRPAPAGPGGDHRRHPAGHQLGPVHLVRAARRPPAARPDPGRCRRGPGPGPHRHLGRPRHIRRTARLGVRRGPPRATRAPARCATPPTGRRVGRHPRRPRHRHPLRAARSRPLVGTGVRDGERSGSRPGLPHRRHRGRYGRTPPRPGRTARHRAGDPGPGVRHRQPRVLQRGPGLGRPDGRTGLGAAAQPPSAARTRRRHPRGGRGGRRHRRVLRSAGPPRPPRRSPERHRPRPARAAPGAPAEVRRPGGGRGRRPPALRPHPRRPDLALPPPGPHRPARPRRPQPARRPHPPLHQPRHRLLGPAVPRLRPQRDHPARPPLPPPAHLAVAPRRPGAVDAGGPGSEGAARRGRT